MTVEVHPRLAGYHLHAEHQAPCHICAAENDAFDDLLNTLGAEELELRLRKLPVVKAYNQRYPYDQHAYIGQLEGVYVDRGSSVFNDAQQLTPEQELIDKEAVEELLAPLTPEQRHIIVETSKGFKPRDIAEQLGHHTSGVVRLNKYEAKRELGAPVNTKMRRGKK